MSRAKQHFIVYREDPRPKSKGLLPESACGRLSNAEGRSNATTKREAVTCIWCLQYLSWQKPENQEPAR